MGSFPETYIDPRGIPSINVLTLKYVGFFCGGGGGGGGASTNRQ